MYRMLIVELVLVLMTRNKFHLEMVSYTVFLSASSHQNIGLLLSRCKNSVCQKDSLRQAPFGLINS